MADPKNPVIQDDVTEEEGMHVHKPEESPARQGEGEAGGSAPDVTSDDDVDKMLKEVGIKREPGKTLAEEIEEDEKASQTGEAKEPEAV